MFGITSKNPDTELLDDQNVLLSLPTKKTFSVYNQNITSIRGKCDNKPCSAIVKSKLLLNCIISGYPFDMYYLMKFL